MESSKNSQEIKNALTSEKSFDSSVFDHPVAQEIRWGPKVSGGSSFKTRALKKISSTRLVYKGDKQYKFFGNLLVFVSIVITIVMSISFYGIGFNVSDLGSSFIPLIFFITGVLIIYYGNRPITIDKKLGYLYKSYKKPKTENDITSGQKWIKLDNVIALQVLSERVILKNSSHTSYEINFILKDTTRYNVIDHGDLPIIEKDAIIISNFLNVPIWNKMTGKTTLPEGAAYTDDTSHYDSKGQYDSSSRYDDPSENDRYSSSSQDNDDLDEPYNSLKKRKL